jgi:L-ribulokinase
MNGRRTPYANQALKGVISGINLGSDAPRIFKSLVEATAFGARKIVERFREEGVEINEIIAVGGIPKKSAFVMQVHADVLNMPINVAASDQACALGAAMAAAAAAGIYPSVNEAQKAMGTGFEKTYKPDPEKVKIYNTLYDKYCLLGNFIENELTPKREEDKEDDE